jgi:hypothetical protein
MVVIAVPALIALFLIINRHYRTVGRRLRAGTAAVRAAPAPTNTVILYVEDLDVATAEAAWYARQIAGSDYHPVHVPGHGRRPDPRERWLDFSGGGTQIETLEEGEGNADAVVDYVWALPRGESAFVTVVVPEVFERPSLTTAIARRRTTFSLKLRLLSEPGVVVTDVPVVLGSQDAQAPAPQRAIARVLVSGVQAASLRSIKYTQALGLDDARAVFFAFDVDEAKKIRRDWEREEIDLPLDVAEAPTATSAIRCCTTSVG